MPDFTPDQLRVIANQRDVRLAPIARKALEAAAAQIERLTTDVERHKAGVEAAAKVIEFLGGVPKR